MREGRSHRHPQGGKAAMKWSYQKDEMDQKHVYTFTFTDEDLIMMGPIGEYDRAALKFFGEKEDAESKLMGLQIIAKRIATAIRDRKCREGNHAPESGEDDQGNAGIA